MTSTTADLSHLTRERDRIRQTHLKPSKRAARVDGPYAEVLGGLHHMAISVDPDRWAELVERLKAAGVEHEVHSGVSVYFRDPDGARIELIADPLGEMYGHQVL